MNNRFNQQRERGPPPHLDVRSQNLVYLTGVPTAIGGKELKNRLANQFGRIKFVETFEAWLRRLTGNIVIDFTTYDDSEAFMTAVINGRIQFLDGAGVQHIGIVGARHFFELIHRNTDIDLFYCDGKPNADWVRNRRPRASGGKPYDRPAPRPRANPPGTGSNMVPLAAAGSGPNRQIPPPRNMNQISGVKSGGGGGPSNNAQPIRAGVARRDRNSPSDEDDEMVGPFPTSSSVSASLRRLIKFSIWQSQATGKAHILQFCSPNKQNENDGQPRTRPSSPLPGMIYGKRRSRTPLPVSTRKTMADDNNWTPRRRSASAHRRPQRSISPPQFFQHRPRISSFHQPKPQQFANKNGHLNNYNFQWSQGRSPERSGNHAAIASRIEPAPMVVGLDLTKERMRQTRRQHHRYLRTPSPQFLFGSGNNSKKASGEIQGTIQTHSRHPHLYQQANTQQPMTPFSSGTSSSAGHSSSFTANAGGHLFSPIRGASNGLFMFRALSSNANRGRDGGQFGRGGGGPIHRNNLWKNDYEMFWPKHRRGAANKRGQMRENGLEPDIILIDDSPEGTNRSSGIGHSSFFSTPSFAAKPTKKAKHKHHRNREDLEEGELTDETDDEDIDDGIIGREEPMDIDEEHEGKKAEEDEEKSKEVEEGEEEEFNIDEYEAPFEFVEDDDEVQQQLEKENNQKGAEEEANDVPTSGDGEQIAPENDNNIGGGNIDDILDGISVGDLNEIDENALLGETDDEQQQEEDGEDEEEEEGDQRPAAQKSNSSLEQSPQNSQIGDDDEILVLGVRRISIDAGNGQNAMTGGGGGGGGGGGPIGIGRKGQRIQLVKSEIMEPAEMGGDGNGSSDKPLLLL